MQQHGARHIAPTEGAHAAELSTRKDARAEHFPRDGRPRWRECFSCCEQACKRYERGHVRAYSGQSRRGCERFSRRHACVSRSLQILAGAVACVSGACFLFLLGSSRWRCDWSPLLTRCLSGAAIGASHWMVLWDGWWVSKRGLRAASCLPAVALGSSAGSRVQR
jgi:hypothetical protein